VTLLGDPVVTALNFSGERNGRTPDVSHGLMPEKHNEKNEKPSYVFCGELKKPAAE